MLRVERLVKTNVRIWISDQSVFRIVARSGSGMGGGRGKSSPKYKLFPLLVFLVLLCGSQALSTPEKSYSIDSKAYVNGVKLTQGDSDYTIALEVDGVELVSYRMGDYPVDFYTLLVPMDTDSTIPDKGFPGDKAYIYINGTVIDENPVHIGSHGQTSYLDIHVMHMHRNIKK